MLIPGSAAEYGLALERPLAETDAMRPVNAYATMKCAVELVATSPTFAGKANVVWPRVFNIVGPGQDLDAPVPCWASKIIQLEFAGGGVLRTGNLDVVRDFLDVRDVADIFLDLVRCDVAGVVNVAGSGVGVVADVVENLVEQTTVPVIVKPDDALSRVMDPLVVVADVTRLNASDRLQSPYRTPQTVLRLFWPIGARVEHKPG